MVCTVWAAEKTTQVTEENPVASAAQDQFSEVRQDSPVTVKVDELEYADSPRLGGEDCDHVRALAELGPNLPPIIVHRKTMRVIDGMHRLRAAILNNQREIEVQFFDGTERDAFVLAVRTNIGHGLPLSLTDREAAARRIVMSHPQWSDRAIAEAAGLASTTVARIRHRMADVDSQPDARIGKDGRTRPISSAAGRREAGRLMADNPEASLREIAEKAGISPATARDVRERVRRGDDPVPLKQVQAERRQQAAQDEGRGETAVHDRVQRQRRMREMSLILQKLQRDPAVRRTDSGRMLLQWLNAHAVSAKEWDGIEAGIPPHCAALVADLAAICAKEWSRIAKTVKQNLDN
jgi:ParB-like chromosome segregation protein Spo0J